MCLISALLHIIYLVLSSSKNIDFAPILLSTHYIHLLLILLVYACCTVFHSPACIYSTLNTMPARSAIHLAIAVSHTNRVSDSVSLSTPTAVLIVPISKYLMQTQMQSGVFLPLPL